MVRCLGGIARGADFRLAAFAFGDVAVDEHHTAVRHRVVTYLDDRAIRSRALEAVMVSQLGTQSCNLGLWNALAKLASLREIADVLVELGSPSEKLIRQIEQFLEILVPGSEMQRLIE